MRINTPVAKCWDVFCFVSYRSQQDWTFSVHKSNLFTKVRLLFGFLLFSNFPTSASRDHGPYLSSDPYLGESDLIDYLGQWAYFGNKAAADTAERACCTLPASCALGQHLGEKPIYLPAYWLQGSLEMQVSGSQWSFQAVRLRVEVQLLGSSKEQ